MDNSTHPQFEERPWGSFTVLTEGDGFKSKIIQVKPEGQLSLQSHKHRAEHWVVARGTATVTLGEEKFDLEAGQSIDIPKGAIHRIENFSDAPVDIIEVQYGSYLGEDDIVRYEDIYGR